MFFLYIVYSRNNKDFLLVKLLQVYSKLYCELQTNLHKTNYLLMDLLLIQNLLVMFKYVVIFLTFHKNAQRWFNMVRKIFQLLYNITYTLVNPI